MNWRAVTNGIQLALRAALAAACAVAIAQYFKFEHPIYAFLAAVIVTDLNPSTSRQLGLQRLMATVVGAVCGAALTPLLPAGPIAIGISILVAMLVCQLLRMNEGAKVAGFICGIIVFDDSAEPWRTGFFRFAETVLGIGAAWVISHVPKLIRTDEESQS
jgi:uncharacterized membrane protein YgaE (UPF0421/DUF939 family)